MLDNLTDTHSDADKSTKTTPTFIVSFSKTPDRVIQSISHKDNIPTTTKHAGIPLGLSSSDPLYWIYLQTDFISPTWTAMFAHRLPVIVYVSWISITTH